MSLIGLQQFTNCSCLTTYSQDWCCHTAVFGLYIHTPLGCLDGMVFFFIPWLQAVQSGYGKIIL